MPILDMLKAASVVELNTARGWVADNLHVPDAEVTDTVAVAYIECHYRAGSLEGWEGFTEDISNRPAEMVDVMSLAARVSLSDVAAEIRHVEGPYETGSGATQAVLWLRRGPYGISLTQGGSSAYDGPRGFALAVVRKTGEWMEETGTPCTVDSENPVVPYGIERNPDVERVAEIIRELVAAA